MAKCSCCKKKFPKEELTALGTCERCEDKLQASADLLFAFDPPVIDPKDIPSEGNKDGASRAERK